MLERLPPHLWRDKRRKRSYVNQVLARGELNSSYRPARQLFARARHGHYLLNPALLLRQGEAWLGVYELLALDWINVGCDPADHLRSRPAQIVALLGADGGAEVQQRG